VISALTVTFTARASKQTRRAVAWWRENRPAAPDVLEQELRNVLALVAAVPTLGAIARDTRIQEVRRVLLRRTHYYVYYRVEAALGRLEVLALWHTSRHFAHDGASGPRGTLDSRPSSQSSCKDRPA
jgi:plasmid stabilization system protein ParE